MGLVEWQKDKNTMAPKPTHGLCSAAYLASFFHHDVVTMPVTNAKDIRSYTVASTGQGELLNCSVQVIPGDRHRSNESDLLPRGWGTMLLLVTTHRSPTTWPTPNEHKVKERSLERVSQAASDTASLGLSHLSPCVLGVLFQWGLSLHEWYCVRPPWLCYIILGPGNIFFFFNQLFFSF